MAHQEVDEVASREPAKTSNQEDKINTTTSEEAEEAAEAGDSVGETMTSPSEIAILLSLFVRAGS